MSFLRKATFIALFLTSLPFTPAYSHGTALNDIDAQAERPGPILERRVSLQTVEIINYDWRGREICRGGGVFVGDVGLLATSVEVLEDGYFAEAITAGGESCTIERVLAGDESSGLVLVQLEDVPEDFEPVSRVSDLPDREESVILPVGRRDKGLDFAQGAVTDLHRIPEETDFLHLRFSPAPYGAGCPVFDEDGALAAIVLFQVEEGESVIVVSAAKLFSLAGRRRPGMGHTEWTENRDSTWKMSSTGSYLTGMAQYLDGRYDRARGFLENALLGGKGLCEETYFYLGNCYEAEGLHRKAIQAYADALRFNPHSSRVLEHLAWAGMKAGEPETAVDACYRAIMTDGGDKKKGFLLMARIRNSCGDFWQAVSAAYGALEFDPSCACAYNELGVSFNGLGLYDQAADALEKAVSLDPQYGEAFNNLGCSYLRSGQIFKAIVVLKHAAATRPEFSHALKNLGEAYSRAGMSERSMEAYRKALGMCQDDPHVFSRLAEEYARRGEFQKAIEIYRSGIRELPRSAWLHYKLGRTHCHVGDRDSAAAVHRRLKELNRAMADQLLIWMNTTGGS
ncbi:MAG: tetratricopeptide repeat protein [bacterium]|nr:MAG: tetratricopeptide repeat protein [bacterium]